MERYQATKDGEVPMPMLGDGLGDLAEMLDVMPTQRQKLIVTGRILDRTPDRYRRQRLLDDLEGMVEIDGYVPDFFCDTRIAEQLIDEGLVEKVVVSHEKPKRFGYKLIGMPF